jgi:ubiquinone/menaquinone biosynthesis C-methylase UbiE
MTMDADLLNSEAVAVPAYLAKTYWWAYVHPRAVKVFERQWLVNLILWGNFGRLRDAALAAMGERLDGRTLQVACVYGDLTPRLAARAAPGGALDVVDVLPVQLDNLARKLPAGAPVNLMHGDSTRLPAPDGSYDRVLVFFLLHEQPEDVRAATLAEALRVLKPGGKLVVVDYHRPRALHPLRAFMHVLLARLEPYALDLWRREITAWMPATAVVRGGKRLFYGGLYQMLEVTR